MFESPEIVVNCLNWTDCEGDENGNCFVYPTGSSHPGEADAHDCNEEDSGSFLDGPGNKLVIEWGNGSNKIMYV